MPKPTPRTQVDEVVYPDIKVTVARGNQAITADDMRKLLGVEEIPEGAGKEAEAMFELGGKRYRCLHNSKNRPFYPSHGEALGQDLLKKNQKFNGEAIIVSKYGNVISGQHRGYGLIWADHQWRTDPRWKHYWPDGPPVWESVVVYGVEEDAETLRTLDNTRPRSDGDVLITSGYFDNTKPDLRKVLIKTLCHAVRLLWHRTARDRSAFSPNRTNSEVVAFADLHPKLKECCKHIVGENGDDGNIRSYCGLGSAAGLLYLMGSSATEPANYRQRIGKGEQPTERQLDWDNWDKACQFWVELAKGKKSKQLGEVRAYRAGNLAEDVSDPHSYFVFERGSNLERISVLSEAWNIYSASGKVKVSDLHFSWLEPKGEDGWLFDGKCPSVGGVDYGDHEPEEPDEDEPDEEEVAEQVEADKTTAKAGKDGKDSKRSKEKAQAQAGIDAAKATARERAEVLKTGSQDEKLEALREEYPGALLLVKRGINYAAYGQDATEVSTILKTSIKLAGATQLCEVPAKGLNEAMKKLKNAGNKVEIVTLPGVNGKKR